MKPEHERLNDYIDDLQAGKHPDIGPAASPDELVLFQSAASWNAMRPGLDEPSPEFVSYLRARLDTAASGSAAGGGQGAAAKIIALPLDAKPARQHSGV